MSSQQDSETARKGLPAPVRYITSHSSDGKSVFSDSIDPTIPAQTITPDTDFSLAYTTSQFPVAMQGDQDIEGYRGLLEGAKPGLSIKGGTVLRIVDFAPGNAPIMHRTVSLDYGIVLVGEVRCLLDSGESRLVKAGEVVVQRQTNHAWENASKDKWARMIFVLQEAEALTVGSQTLSEDYGTLRGAVPSS